MFSRLRRLPKLESLEHRWMLAADVGLPTSSTESEAEGEGEIVPDFSLLDVNPTSATFNQSVSPQDYRGQITGWYFGHAT